LHGFALVLCLPDRAIGRLDDGALPPFHACSQLCDGELEARVPGLGFPPWVR
jgi:hypothetical protein